MGANMDLLGIASWLGILVMVLQYYIKNFYWPSFEKKLRKEYPSNTPDYAQQREEKRKKSKGTVIV